MPLNFACLLRWGFYLTLAVVSVLVTLPLETAISIGGDDGFELSKSLLLARRPDLAQNIWNDQPWLYTLITTQAFRLFGEHAAIPRLYGLVLLFAFFLALVKTRTCDRLTLSLVAVFLFTGDQMPYLIFSAMPEVPTVCISWIGLLCLFWGWKDERLKYALSGAVFAVAVHVKFTAIIIAPVVFLIPFWNTGATGYVRRIGTWLFSFGGLFLILVWASPSFDLNQLLDSHLTVSAALWAEVSPSSGAFRFAYVMANPALLVASIIGIASSISNRNRLGLLCCMALVCVCLFAAFHRPWWRYYMVHFDFPLAILAGIGISKHVDTFISILRSRVAHRDQEGPRRYSGSILCTSAVVSLFWGFTMPNSVWQFSRVSGATLASEDPVVQACLKYKDETRWCYASKNDYAFAAKMLVPPELIVLSSKRAFATEFEGLENQMLSTLKRYRPEVFLVRKEVPITTNWIEFIEENYALEQHTPEVEVWIHKSLQPDVLSSHDVRLQSMGL